MKGGVACCCWFLLLLEAFQAHPLLIFAIVCMRFSACEKPQCRDWQTATRLLRLARTTCVDR